MAKKSVKKSHPIKIKKKFRTAVSKIKNKDWRDESIFIVKAGSKMKAQPATKVASYHQTVYWDGQGKTVDLPAAPNSSNLDQITYNVGQTQVSARVIAAAGTQFTYEMFCEGIVVEGNSPPVIIVE